MKTIENLRESLFDTLDGVKNGTIDVDRSKAVCEIANCIIDTARTEIELVKTIGAMNGSGFIKLLDNKTS
jgi:hypothetical protein